MPAADCVAGILLSFRLAEAATPRRFDDEDLAGMHRNTRYSRKLYPAFFARQPPVAPRYPAGPTRKSVRPEEAMLPHQGYFQVLQELEGTDDPVTALILSFSS